MQRKRFAPATARSIFRTMNKRLWMAVIGLAACGALRADEVEDSIAAALKAYQSGKPAEASNALQKALKVLSEKAAGRWQPPCPR